MEAQEIKLRFKVKKPILSLGSNTKNTVCFTQGYQAHISSVNNDLNEPDGLRRFERLVQYYLKKKPVIIAYDLHPEYQSSKCALRLLAGNKLTGTPVQHHHAHIASCMLENYLVNQRVIGIAFDGTGLGTDNQLWGAEFLLCDYKSFKRKAHFRELFLAGGEKAILEPGRIVSCLLYAMYKDKFLRLGIPFTRNIDRKKWLVLQKMLAAGFNTYQASSMGRLFDAAACLVFAEYKAQREAALAKRLEAAAGEFCWAGSGSGYRFKIVKQTAGYIIDHYPVFKKIIQDLQRKVPATEIAYKFHLGVAEALKDMCVILRREEKTNTVALSGGVFQNRILLNLAVDLLKKEDFKVFTHHKLSCGDSSLSLGQAAVAYYQG